MGFEQKVEEYTFSLKEFMSEIDEELRNNNRNKEIQANHEFSYRSDNLFLAD